MKHERLRRFKEALLDLLFPPDAACLCCDAALAGEGEDGICPACIRALEELQRRQESLEKTDDRPAAPGLESMHAAFSYEGAARTLILALKYKSIRRAAIPLAKAMAYLPAGEAEMIVPVPSTKRRIRERGFNQAQLLAQEIGRTLGMEVVPALRREREGASQVRMNAAQRRQNLIGCMNADGSVAGKRVMLVDDVYTTGSTAEEAARALFAAGAVSVNMICAARTLRDANGDVPFAL